MLFHGKYVRLSVLTLLFFATAFLFPPGYSQEKNAYGLAVISSMEEYERSARLDSNNLLLNISHEIPGIALNMVYATPDNFLGETLYELPLAFARRPVLMALKQVQRDLNNEGLGLVIYDAYRPYAVTVKMFEMTQDTVYVAVPWRGSRHNRGCAVDVSLLSLQTGKELQMPTPFDDFSEKAHPDYADLPAPVIANREKLINTMEKYGFTVYPAEWWHFDYQGWEKYPILDLPLDSLAKDRW